MTKQVTQKAIIAKLNQLNKRIDIKIYSGESYKKEMTQHTKLFLALKSLK